MTSSKPNFGDECHGGRLERWGGKATAPLVRLSVAVARLLPSLLGGASCRPLVCPLSCGTLAPLMLESIVMSVQSPGESGEETSYLGHSLVIWVLFSISLGQIVMDRVNTEASWTSAGLSSHDDGSLFSMSLSFFFSRVILRVICLKLSDVYLPRVRY